MWLSLRVKQNYNGRKSFPTKAINKIKSSMICWIVDPLTYFRISANYFSKYSRSIFIMTN